MKLLDLFCGGGGASMGYHLAGFEVTGVDLSPMPQYPFTFHQGDALAFCACRCRSRSATKPSPPSWIG